MRFNNLHHRVSPQTIFEFSFSDATLLELAILMTVMVAQRTQLGLIPFAGNNVVMERIKEQMRVMMEMLVIVMGEFSELFEDDFL